MTTTKAKYHISDDPEAHAVLADLRALYARAYALQRKSDRESGVVGHFWRVTDGLRHAIDGAEADLLPVCEFCGEFVTEYPKDPAKAHAKCIEEAKSNG